MELLEILKQFKTITPDPDFTTKSKRAVLAELPLENPVFGVSGIRRIIFHVIETGVAVGLAGLFIILITGGFSGSVISPVKFSAIDPQTLHAEAQAIDAQIDLASVNYSEPAAVTESTQKIAASLNKEISVTVASSTPSSTITTEATTTPSLSIDQALQALSQ
jgi:hypothetical protein